MSGALVGPDPHGAATAPSADSEALILDASHGQGGGTAGGGDTFGRLGRALFGSNSVIVVLVVVALVLIYRGESSVDGQTARLALFGYLGTTILGAVSFLRWGAGRGAWIDGVAYSLVAVFVVELVFLLLAENGLLSFVWIATGTLLIFASGVTGVVAIALAALWALRSGRSGPHGLTQAATAIVLGVAIGLAPGAASQPPSGPLPTPLPPPVTPLVAFTPDPTPTQAATPVPTDAGTPSPTASPIPTPPPARIVLRLGGNGGGKVTSQPAGIDCPGTCDALFPSGESVTLTAAPDGSAFTGWSGDCGGQRTCELTVSVNHGAAAFFERVAIGYDAQWVNDGPVSASRGADTTIQISVLNTGTTTWTRDTSSEVWLGQCCPLGSSSPLQQWAVNWTSDQVYARTTQSVVAPGQIGTLRVTIRVPKDAAPGIYVLDGILQVARTGAPVSGGSISLSLIIE